MKRALLASVLFVDTSVRAEGAYNVNHPAYRQSHHHFQRSTVAAYLIPRKQDQRPSRCLNASQAHFICRFPHDPVQSLVIIIKLPLHPRFRHSAAHIVITVFLLPALLPVRVPHAKRAIFFLHAASKVERCWDGRVGVLLSIRNCGAVVLLREEGRDTRKVLCHPLSIPTSSFT